MNLIEQLGGYECAAYEYKNTLLADDFPYVIKATGTKFTRPELGDELLEHRRQHNIFEVGDLIMYENKMYEIKYIYHPEKARITDGLQGRTVYDFPRGIRHATDDEIKAVKGWVL